MYQPVQILSKSQPFTAKTFDSERGSHSFKITVQQFERWRVHIIDESIEFPNEMQCYIVEEPFEVEITSLASLQDREYIFEWTSEPSDLDGCFQLGSPTRVTHNLALEDKSIPTICLMDKLEELSFLPLRVLFCTSEVVVKRMIAGDHFRANDISNVCFFFRNCSQMVPNLSIPVSLLRFIICCWQTPPKQTMP